MAVVDDLKAQVLATVAAESAAIAYMGGEPGRVQVAVDLALADVSAEVATLKVSSDALVAATPVA